MPYFVYDKISLGPITLYTWGIFIALAFIIGYWLILKRAKKQGISQKHIFYLTIAVFLGSIIGSRLFYIFQFPQYYFSNPLEILQIWRGGMMFYGGFFGGLITGWFYLKKNNIDFWKMADVLAPAIALGIFIGRIGCSLINNQQGSLTGLPWAIQWPDGSLRHPVNEYLALNGLILFSVLLFLERKIRKTGQLFFVFLFWYCFTRFLLDFTRVADTLLANSRHFSLTNSQWISLLILIFLIFLLIKRGLKKSKDRI